LLFNSLEREVDLFNKYIPNRAIEKNVIFSTPEMPLPYQQTSREPINESIRSEIWRRDGGKCVKCGSKQNLEFDHIIPVSKGGATSVQNLQLLCKQCNLTKSNKI
jgi:5-methylcytosine-specific restriction endonuclease McrA